MESENYRKIKSGEMRKKLPLRTVNGHIQSLFGLHPISQPVIVQCKCFCSLRIEDECHYPEMSLEPRYDE